jgi:hypothetical protein
MYVAPTDMPGAWLTTICGGLTSPQPPSLGREAMVGPPTRPVLEHHSSTSMRCSAVPVMGLAALRRALEAVMPPSTQSSCFTRAWATRKRAEGGCAEALKPKEP